MKGMTRAETRAVINIDMPIVDDEVHIWQSVRRHEVGGRDMNRLQRPSLGSYISSQYARTGPRSGEFRVFERRPLARKSPKRIIDMPACCQIRCQWIGNQRVYNIDCF
jgi:hypothetical protein